jgi:hypothetical protein
MSWGALPSRPPDPPRAFAETESGSGAVPRAEA